jgi:hypothetical protein
VNGSYPERIVCLTEEPTEVLYALGEQDRIAGISGFTVRPARARQEKPRVSAFTSAKIDRILALEPDLAIGFSDMQADIARELIRQPGPGATHCVCNECGMEWLHEDEQARTSRAGADWWPSERARGCSSDSSQSAGRPHEAQD